MPKPCSCSIEVLELMNNLRTLLDIYEGHAQTGRLQHTDVTEIRDKIEKSTEQLKTVGEVCGIDVINISYFLENAIRHYESGLMRGDVHSFAESAEIAAESELPLLRELWKCQAEEKER